MKLRVTTNLQMMFIIISLLLLSMGSLYANHIRGGYLTGERISANSLTYRFTVYLYRDNGGVPPQPGTFEFGYSNAEPELVVPESLGFIDGYTDNQGDPTEILVYQVEHTFPTEGEYKVSYYEQNRNPAVSNMSNSGNTAFFLESIFNINSALGMNTSPQLLNKIWMLAYPGRKFTFNPIGYDAEGDSLSYRFTVCKQGLDEEGNAVNVDSYKYPDHPDFNGEREDGSGSAVFLIDPETGLITWDAPGDVGEFTYAFYIDEWRDGVLISSINCDFQVISSLVEDDIPSSFTPEIESPSDICLDYYDSVSDFILISKAYDYQIKSELIDQGKLIITDSSYVENNEIRNLLKLDLNNLTKEDIQEDSYIISISANNLVEVSKEWKIKILGEAPAAPIGERGLDNKTINLSWESYNDSTAEIMSIWRAAGSVPDSIDCFDFEEEGADFIKVGEVSINDTTFIDYNEGIEFKALDYYYVLIANYAEPSGGESKHSEILTVEYTGDVNNASIKGTVFYDGNQNGILDDGEIGLTGFKSTLLPENLITISNESGAINYSVPLGNYDLGLISGEKWTFTTDSTYQINLEEDDATDYLFGLVTVVQDTAVVLDINNPRVRCQEDVVYTLTYKNNSSFTLDQSEITLNFDTKFTLIESSLTPLSFTDSTIIWQIENLNPTEQGKIEITFKAPDFTNLGNTVANEVIFENELITEEKTVTQIVNCTYDPNDKLVTPTGVKGENYTLKNEFLEYTIRFQNTGNDTAYNIEIRDELDNDLDVSTFELVSHSDSLNIEINKFNELIFNFDNIFLPDSNANEKASHGFVKYRIKPKENLPDFTEITNTAYIYFDFNPAIATNTTLNTLVDFIPPNAPESLSYSNVSATSVDLNWIHEDDTETSFILERSVDSFFSVITSFILPANTTSYRDTTLSPNTTYSYRMRAYNNSVPSPYSNTLTISLVTSTDQQEDNIEFMVYPNPASTILYIAASHFEQNSFVYLRNMVGEVVKTKTISSNNHRDEIQLDIANLPKGFYMLEFHSGNRKYFKKVIVE
ncbi:DUF7619 domain-containing protein [Chondrinema litorale]|uniref:DUF7619 domain-containing protein n=1 Tax=Chondrinema litorale TaxID=2994555 RepID=UPI002542EC35|nr:T9SS type A sorting domain-containing protein [Chondrinema litorale]UZR98129.1 T9SS type A sorting domain-containing protein [Chondrinema litorale]